MPFDGNPGRLSALRKPRSKPVDMTPATIGVAKMLRELHERNSARMRAWSNYREMIDGFRIEVPNAEPVVVPPALREPTPLELEMLEDIAQWLENTVVFSQIELWEGVRRAHEALLDLGGKDAPRRYVVSVLRRYLALWISAAQPDRGGKAPRQAAIDRVRRIYLVDLMGDLRRAHEAFVSLSPDFVSAALDAAAEVEASGKKGGAENIGIFGLAARLSTQCKAFGDSKTAATKAARAFRDACKPKAQRKR